MATLGDTFLLDRQPFWLRHIQIAISSVGAAYHGQYLHIDLDPYRFRREILSKVVYWEQAHPR
jgi:hypothetical protein